MKKVESAIFASLVIIGAIGFSGTTISAQDDAGDETSETLSIERAAQQFVEQKRVIHERNEAALARRDRAASLPQLQRLIRDSHFLRPRTDGVKPQTQQAIEDSLITEASQYLAASNFNPDRVSRYMRAGFNPLDSAINLTRGSPTPTDLAILSDRIVVGRFSSIQNDPSAADISIVTLDVDETVLGEKTDSISFQQAGSVQSPLRATLLDDSIGTVLVFLTDPGGNLRGLRTDLQPTVGANIVAPFTIQGGKLTPLGLSTVEPFILDELKTAIGPLHEIRRSRR